MKHAVAALFVLLFVIVGLVLLTAALWPVTRGASPTITLAIMAGIAFILAAGIAIPTDLTQALTAGKPLLDRVPLPAVARATIAQRVSTSVSAVPDDVKP